MCFRRLGILHPSDAWPSRKTEMPKSEERIVESAVEARAGFLGRPVLIVLVVSVTVAVIAMALSYAGVFATT